MKLEFNNPNPTILVVGDIMLDYYLWGNCERISPEAPVQIVDILKDSTILGGGGNVIQNLLTFGAKVDIASVIGDDDPGSQLIQMLRNIGAGVELLVRQPNRRSSKKTRIIAANQQVVRYDRESKDPISSESEERLLALLDAGMDLYDVVLVSDYGKGVLTPSLTQYVIKRAKASGIKVLIDPKGADYAKYAGAFLITPNKKEAGLATKISIRDSSSLQDAGFKLKRNLQLEYAVITLSEDGIALFADQMHHIPTKARDVFDVTGAGDTVLASLGFAVANGIGIMDACHFANYAAGVVVSKVGSATATLDEIEEYVTSFIKSGSHLYIKSSNNITQISARLKESGKKIVFMDGVFDTVSPRQVKVLEAAKSYGDILIVGVNADASAGQMSSNGSLVNNEEDRAYLLAALKVVDYVVVFPEDTPYELIKSIKPDILVKDQPAAGEGVIGKDLVGEVRIIGLTDDLQGIASGETRFP